MLLREVSRLLVFALGVMVSANSVGATCYDDCLGTSFQPVCGANHFTYYSSCYASCDGVSHVPGSCGIIVASTSTTPVAGMSVTSSPGQDQSTDAPTGQNGHSASEVFSGPFAFIHYGVLFGVVFFLIVVVGVIYLIKRKNQPDVYSEKADSEVPAEGAFQENQELYQLDSIDQRSAELRSWQGNNNNKHNNNVAFNNRRFPLPSEELRNSDFKSSETKSTSTPILDESTIYADPLPKSRLNNMRPSIGSRMPPPPAYPSPPRLPHTLSTLSTQTPTTDLRSNRVPSFSSFPSLSHVNIANLELMRDTYQCLIALRDAQIAQGDTDVIPLPPPPPMILDMCQSPTQEEIDAQPYIREMHPSFSQKEKDSQFSRHSSSADSHS